jgi:glucokinase
VASHTILAGDIGGTKTALAWVEDGTITGSRVFPSSQYASLEATPVRVIVSPTVALLGAAHAALGLRHE